MRAGPPLGTVLLRMAATYPTFSALRRTVPPLRVFRVAAGLSQRELARLSGVSEDAISLAERGRHVPRRATVRALAAALGVDPLDLTPAPPSEEVATDSDEVAVP